MFKKLAKAIIATSIKREISVGDAALVTRRNKDMVFIRIKKIYWVSRSFAAAQLPRGCARRMPHPLLSNVLGLCLATKGAKCNAIHGSPAAMESGTRDGGRNRFVDDVVLRSRGFDF